MKGLSRLRQDERGATSIEYALIAGIISLSILVGARLIGPRLAQYYGDVGSNLT